MRPSGSDAARETRPDWRSPDAGRPRGSERHVLIGAGVDLARAVDAARVAVQHHANHHLRLIGRLAADILLAIEGVDRLQVQRRGHILHKPRQKAVREPVVKRRAKEDRLVDLVRQEVLADEKSQIRTTENYGTPCPSYDRQAPRLAEFAVILDLQRVASTYLRRLTCLKVAMRRHSL